MKRFFWPIILITISMLVLPGMSVNQGSVPGQSYWGRKKYIEYIAGNLPIIISAPHGGYLKPTEIPNRTWGTLGNDYKSQEYTLEVANYIKQMTGRWPHVIINHLHRVKLDANNDIEKAAQGHRWAEHAWYEFHQFIDDAKAEVKVQCGKGIYFDFHTNAHPQQWVEIGLGLTASDLDRSNSALNASKYKNRSTLKSLAYRPGIYFPEIIRGQTSLGGLLQSRNYKSVPSPSYPDPNGGGYFNGGYNVRRHGSLQGGTIDGIQVETYYKFLSNNVRDRYSRALAAAIVDIYQAHYKCSNISSPGPQPYKTYLPLLMRHS